MKKDKKKTKRKEYQKKKRAKMIDFGKPCNFDLTLIDIMKKDT